MIDLSNRGRIYGVGIWVIIVGALVLRFGSQAWLGLWLVQKLETERKPELEPEPGPGIIYAVAEGNGCINPSGDIDASLHKNLTFSIVPDPGYVVDSVVLDHVNLGNVRWLTLADSTRHWLVRATFKKK
jgi:hypothetical protein